MPRLLPFRGVRYQAAALHGDRPSDPDLSDVVAPPYDVVDETERRALADRHPANSVRLILPEGPEHADARPAVGDGAAAGSGDDRYRRAARQWADWLGSGVLRVDGDPAFYPYRMEYRDDAGGLRTTTGVLGALGLPDVAGGDRVLPHERTLPKAKSDRLALLRATRANLDPIWGLSAARGLTRLLDLGPPVATAVDDDGTRHALGAVTDPERTAAISDAVGSAPLVLADGHHRFETAIAYRDEYPADAGAGAILCLVVELAEEELCVRPIHRLVPRLPPGVDLPGDLDPVFQARASGANTPGNVDDLAAAVEATGGFGLVRSDRLVHMVPWPGALDERVSQLPEPLRRVDSAIFELAVQPALRGASVGYQHGALRAAEAVRNGDAEAAFLLQSVGVETIRAAAEAGIRMPQKTTFFAPKPRTGMVMRSLDADADADSGS